MSLREIRCPHIREDGKRCNRLHFRGDYLRIEIKCPRCKQLVYYERTDLKSFMDKYVRERRVA